jgi:hypothetical protein
MAYGPRRSEVARSRLQVSVNPGDGGWVFRLYERGWLISEKTFCTEDAAKKLKREYVGRREAEDVSDMVTLQQDMRGKV